MPPVVKNQFSHKSLGFCTSSVFRLAGSLLVWMAAFSFISSGNCATPAATRITDENPLATLEVGAYGLRVLSPTLLELTLVNTKDSISARVPNWDFVSDNFAPT